VFVSHTTKNLKLRFWLLGLGVSEVSNRWQRCSYLSCDGGLLSGLSKVFLSI
jgi:hypothetical protein